MATLGIWSEIRDFLGEEMFRETYAEISGDVLTKFFGLKSNKPAQTLPNLKADHREPETKAENIKSYRPPSGKLPGKPLEVSDDWKKSSNLEELNMKICFCEKCRLAAGRTKFVFGEGAPNAELMFIGEGPGRDEDMQGRPFVGRAGQLLTKMINAMQFQREETYIANVVKCRPPENRVPEKDEAESCIPYLMRQIEVVKPKAIVLLGATPARFLLGVNGINEARGKWFEIKGIKTMPTYHPAYLLRNPSAKKTVWADLQLVMAELGKNLP
ncbi:MAG TPA: uracil-DNA glycosylase [Victivallales bacterium]|nr:uracil-DNA glycosylase [Victivallales bacterium]